MSEKKRVNLFLEVDLLEILKDKGYNISYLCNEALKTYATTDFGDIELVSKISVIDSIIADLKITMTQKQLEYDNAKANLLEMEKKRSTIIEEYEDAQNTVRLSRLIQDLNKSIIAANFDEFIVQASCVPILVKIKELSPHFDLHVHVGRFKSVMTS